MTPAADAVLDQPVTTAVTTASEIVLIDLSSIAHPIWHMSQGDPDPDATSTKTVARVHALAGGRRHVAVCCDSSKSFRKDADPDYKANRPAALAPFIHQVRLARERLIADGFPVWMVAGFEADDVIATATARALAAGTLDVLVISADKDLLQLVGPRVRAMSAVDGTMRDEAAVLAKFGVKPEQMCEYLMLVGDASDNVKGANGIGPKKAAELLATYGSVAGIYDALTNHGTQFKPAMATSLREFETRMPAVRALITLRTDVEIPFEEIAAERVAHDAADFGAPEGDPMPTHAPERQQQDLLPDAPLHPIDSPIAHAMPPPVNGAGASTALAAPARTAEVLPAPTEWERQLEPRSVNEAVQLAKHMFESRLFSAYGTPQGVLATIMAGRELGMQAMASLRGFDIIDGKPTYKADLIRALVLKSGKAKYFRCTARSASAATFTTQRGDDPPFDLTYTIEEGKAAFGKSEDAWGKSGWGRNPADMLVARAGSKLARLVYPDVVHGLYSPEEFDV